MRGFATMGGLIVFCVVASLLGFTLASTATFDLQFCQGWESGQSAQRLANSVVHQGIAKIIKDPLFHSDLTITAEAGNGTLTFDRSGSRRFHQQLGKPHPDRMAAGAFPAE